MTRQRTTPGPGQESVWDYPRPPRIETSRKSIRIEAGGILIAASENAKRVLETSHPPVFYLPPADVQMALLETAKRQTWCEWKGRAIYFDLVVDDRRIEHAAWSYPDPTPAFESIRAHLAFYPSLMDACYVGDEQATAQPGDFYGGWITKDIVGPFKGAPGTMGW